MKSLEITTRVSCPIGCHFCPQDKLKAAYRSDVKMFQRDDYARLLAKIPKDTRIDFSGFSEPFSHPAAPAMIDIAINLGFDVALYTTLMGLKEEGLNILAQNPPKLVRIHAPDPKGMKLNEDVWIQAYDAFRAKNIPHTVMAMGPLSVKMNAYAASIGLNVEIPEMLSRGGNLWVPKRIDGTVRCTMNRQTQNVVLPDGNVYLCCMDYGLSTPLGNLFTQSYAEIEVMQQKYINDTNPPHDSICRTCEWACPA